MNDARREAALQRAIADACLAPDKDVSFDNALGSFLETRGVAIDDVAAILAAPRGLAIYRSLVRNGLSGVILRVLPRTRARLNGAIAGRFDADLAAFLAARGPRTHYLRDVPAELLAWARPQWEADANVPADVSDLATYELARFELGASDERAPEGPLLDVALDRSLLFAGAVRLLHCGYAVHEFAGDETSEPAPQRAVTLLAYRDNDHAVRWLELSRAAADLVARWMRGEPVAEAVRATSADAPLAMPEVATLLADLAARGVILGGKSPSR